MIFDDVVECSEYSLKRKRDEDIITFSSEDLWEVQTSYDDAIIIFLIIVNYNVKRVLVNNIIFTDVLFYDAFL